nr:MAG TPA: Endonuclease [Caudoviricetes sp.]
MSKYNSKKVEYKGVTFDSKVECDYYQYLERNLGNEYDHIELQPRYELIPKVNKQRKTEYIADFALWKDNKLLEVIDVKGMPTEVAKLKAKIFRDKYPNIKLTWICKAPKYTGLEWIEYDELIKVRRKRKRENNGA